MLAAAAPLPALMKLLCILLLLEGFTAVPLLSINTRHPLVAHVIAAIMPSCACAPRIFSHH
jgi:hypothetical protein